MLLLSGANVLVGCCVTAMALPMAMVKMVMPSTLILNTSPRRRGDRMPVKMMVKHEVLLMSIMFPNLMATSQKHDEQTIVIIRLTCIQGLGKRHKEQTKEPLFLENGLFVLVCLDLDVRDFHAEQSACCAEAAT